MPFMFFIVLRDAIGADKHFADFAFENVRRAQIGAALDAVGDAGVEADFVDVVGLDPGFVSAGHKRIPFVSDFGQSVSGEGCFVSAATP
jgi:hypothetical protein